MEKSLKDEIDAIVSSDAPYAQFTGVLTALINDPGTSRQTLREAVAYFSARTKLEHACHE